MLAYLLIGGNMGDRFYHLHRAEALINLNCGTTIKQSSIYETAAWGFTEQPDFLNKVLTLETSLTPEILMKSLLQIEEEMGRERTIKMGPRFIDIDILMMGDIVMDTDLLKLPHPALPQRRFALLPFAEIAPNLMHPVEKKTISELLAACTDELNVQKISTPA